MVWKVVMAVCSSQRNVYRMMWKGRPCHDDGCSFRGGGGGTNMAGKNGLWNGDWGAKRVGGGVGANIVDL